MSTRLEPGTVVADKVRLERLLGRGGMGSVWVAEHLSLRARVAVKFMTEDIISKAEAHARFEREATAAARINSPHVVKVFDHGVWDELPYIVMELLEGEDLAQRLKRDGPLPVADVVAIVTQVGKALTRAHAKGIVHRDIKPENIFLVEGDDDDWFVKVLDFGIAKQAMDVSMAVTGTGVMLGTPYYMSPEQVMSSREVDHRSDLWSLAVVTYHMLTGRIPFFAETIGALCVKINDAEFRPVTDGREDLPAKLDDWFARALAREPEARFAASRELTTALTAAVATGEPAHGAPIRSSSPKFDALSAGPVTEAIDFNTGPRRSRPTPEAAANAALGEQPGASNTSMEASLTPTPPRRRYPVPLFVAAGVAVAAVLVVAVIAGIATLRSRLAASDASVELVDSAAGSASADVAPPGVDSLTEDPPSDGHTAAEGDSAENKAPPEPSSSPAQSASAEVPAPEPNTASTAKRKATTRPPPKQQEILKTPPWPSAQSKEYGF